MTDNKLDDKVERHIDFSDGGKYPTVFTAIVGTEEAIVGEGAPPVRLYYGKILEWNLSASGETVDELRKNLETVLLTQRLIFDEFPGEQIPSPATEFWQVLNTAESAARGGVWGIDMGKTALRVINT